MLKNIISICSLSCLMMSPTVLLAQNEATQIPYLIEKLPPSFTNLEHKSLGDSLILQWNPLPITPRLTLENGLTLSYGDILMFGGDFFGDSNASIALCTEKDKPACFQKQFNALASSGDFDEQACMNPLNMVPRIRAVLDDLSQSMTEAKSQGIPSWEFYEKNGLALSEKLNRATCGGSKISGFFPFGQYLTLATMNFDHFAPDALTAYQVGHRAALETAQQAHIHLAQQDIISAHTLLQKAYAQNAFACHFLSDAMSAGHMRVPRVALHYRKGLTLFLNLLLANVMHDEDSKLGLVVNNHAGTSWHAFGDGRLEHPDASMHYAILQTIMQQSADAIYTTFQSGILPIQYAEMQLLPDYEHIDETLNHAALFKLENDQILKRKANHDPWDKQWTASWNALLTLLDFAKDRIPRS